MRNYFIAIQPDETTKKSLSELVNFIKPIFETQDIAVNWTKKENFHVSIQFVGRDINFFRKQYTKLKLGKMPFSSYDIKVGRIRLGISRKYRELIYLSIDEGAEKLRGELLKVKRFVGLKREQIFIPHITLGRVNKDLTDEEFRNLSSQLDVFNKENEIDISFNANKPVFLESDLNEYKVV